MNKYFLVEMSSQEEIERLVRNQPFANNLFCYWSHELEKIFEKWTDFKSVPEYSPSHFDQELK